MEWNGGMDWNGKIVAIMVHGVSGQSPHQDFIARYNQLSVNLNQWNGMVEWNNGIEYWNGL